MTELEMGNRRLGGEEEELALAADETTSSLQEDLSIHSRELKVDVKDLINIGSFNKARTVKPVTEDQPPSYVWMMPYCKVACISTLVLLIIFLCLGYVTYDENPGKAQTFKYAGYFMVVLCVIAFIAIIYINSVSDNNLIDTMRSFRRSKAANPQINKKLTKEGHHELKA